MNALCEFLAAHGPMLLIGVTALLLAGTMALLLQRSPIHRQRIAEMTMLGVLVWLVLACLPMHRWSLKPTRPRQAQASSSFIPVATESADFPSDWQSVLASLVRPPQSTPQRPAVRVSPDVSTARAASSDLPRAAAPARPHGPSRTWPLAAGNFVAAAYVAGAAACAAWLLLGHLLLWRVTRRAARPERWLLELFEGACRAVGVRGTRVLVVSAPLRPVSCGLLRPTVLLSVDDCAEPNRARLRQVLLHEAAHLRQRDAWGNALFNLAMPLLYLHPLYWVLRSRTSLTREMVADDIAASATSRAAYAADLLELARTRSGYRPAPLAALGIFRSPSHFYRRMHMLMQRNIRLENRCSTVWKLINGAACAGVLFTASATLGVRAQAQESPKPIEIKQEKLDRDLLNAKAALKQATTDRDTFLREMRANLLPPSLKIDSERNTSEAMIDQLKTELQVAKTRLGEKSPRVMEIETRLQVLRDIREEQRAGDMQRAIAARRSELDSRVALAQKNLDEVQAAQQSVRSAADDNDENAQDQKEQAIRRKAELQARPAREEAVRAQQDARKAHDSAAQGEQIRQMLEAQLKQGEAEMAKLRAQLEQVQAQMKMAAAQAQQEVERAHKMLKEQVDKADRNFDGAADQVRQKIDQIILEKLKKGGLEWANGNDLEELVRRTYLDVAGRLPTPDERNATAEVVKKYLKKFPDRGKGKEQEYDGAKSAKGSAAQLNAAVGGLRPQLDLVALANSYADAVGSIAAAREEIEASATDVHARSAAKAKLVAAEQKAHLLRSITEAALQQAKQEYDLARKRVEAGAAPPNEAVDAEGRMRILSLILQSSADQKPSDLQRQ